MGFPCGSAGKESTYNVGDLGLSPVLGRFPGEGNGYPLRFPGLDTSMDCIVLGVTKSQTRLSDFHLHFMYLLYNVVLASAVPQSDSAICTHTSLPLEPPPSIPPSRSSQRPELSSLCYTAASH